MEIKSLKLTDFRCYEHLNLSFDQRINVFYGDNGSGKTSILEAIYFLSTGKSFRSKRIKNLIRHDQSALTVFTEFAAKGQPPNQLGISLTRQSVKKIRLNQQNITSQSTIAHQLPVVSIDPDSYLFLDKPPQFRRSFFDWLMFHVKPGYLELWSQVSRCQKHLNVLYKDKNKALLSQWEQQYIQHATTLNQLRQDVFLLLVADIKTKIATFIPELTEHQIHFKQGWSQEHDLAEQLSRDREKNLLYGGLNAGVHRMDIQNTIKGKPAHENLSRGQKKIISSIYYLSYIELITHCLGIHPVLCLDDMDAELDLNKAAVFSDFIKDCQNQIFITTVEPSKLSQLQQSTNVFHVKHDDVTLSP